jgi:thioredoxin reductase (NADPH)
MPEKTYDVVIIGSGPAGYTAALYAARANLGTLVFQGFESGGQLMLTSDVENYPGYKDGVQGPDMMDEFEQQAARFGAEMRPDNVEKVDLSERPFKLWAEGEEEPVLAATVVIATGAQAKWLGLESEERLFGKGVSGCATCDAFFFRGKKVAVVGGGDTAMEEAGVLAKFADEVFLIHRRDEFRASKIMLDRAEKNEKITFLTDTTVEEILGETTVEGVRIKNAKTGEESTLPRRRLLRGHRPHAGDGPLRGPAGDGRLWLRAPEGAHHDERPGRLRRGRRLRHPLPPGHNRRRRRLPRRHRRREVAGGAGTRPRVRRGPRRLDGREGRQGEHR